MFAPRPASAWLWRTMIAALLAMILGGCASSPAPASKVSPVSTTPHLSLDRVKEIAVARTRANGFTTEVTDPWSLALQFNGNERIWVALLFQPGKSVPPFEVYVNDATGEANFLSPEVHGEQHFAADADWLEKIAGALAQVHYPIDLDDLIRTGHFAGAECSMGGSTPDGRLFLEYALRRESDLPARFVVTCYYTEPRGAAGPKMVTAAKLVYVDAKLNYYLLTPDNN